MRHNRGWHPEINIHFVTFPLVPDARQLSCKLVTYDGNLNERGAHLRKGCLPPEGDAGDLGPPAPADIQELQEVALSRECHQCRGAAAAAGAPAAESPADRLPHVARQSRARQLSLSFTRLPQLLLGGPSMRASEVPNGRAGDQGPAPYACRGAPHVSGEPVVEDGRPVGEGC